MRLKICWHAVCRRGKYEDASVAGKQVQGQVGTFQINGAPCLFNNEGRWRKALAPCSA